MKECTETDKPLVTIAMAVYNPRMDWFKEQLLSLNDQSYENLELLVLDDCSTGISFEEISQTIKEIITDIPYSLSRNTENLGSTRTFEKLTELAGGDYIAYCDQDDVWYPDKIETLLEYFNNEKIALAFSDARIIDEAGNIKAGSITEFRARHKLYEGSGLSGRLIIQNFVMGCSMLIKGTIAKESLPFIPDMIHDHYLALTASLNGELALCRRPLLSYRIHNDNQTNTLTGIKDKNDYYNSKIRSFLNRMEQLELKSSCAGVAEFSKIKKWAEARNSYYHGNFTAATRVWKYRKFDQSLSLFELIILKMPGFIFRYALNKIKKGK